MVMVGLALESKLFNHLHLITYLLNALEVILGQKVHPISFRLGINKNWDSRWFAGKEYSNFVFEDYKIRKFLKKKFPRPVFPRLRSRGPRTRSGFACMSQGPALLSEKRA